MDSCKAIGYYGIFERMRNGSKLTLCFLDQKLGESLWASNSGIVFLQLEIPLRFHVCFETLSDSQLEKCISLLVHGDDCGATYSIRFSARASALWWSSGQFLGCPRSSVCHQSKRTLDLWLSWSLAEGQEGVFFEVDPFLPDIGDSARVGGPSISSTRVLRSMFNGHSAPFTAVSQHIRISRKATSGSGPLVYTQHGPQASHRNMVCVVGQETTLKDSGSAATSLL